MPEYPFAASLLTRRPGRSMLRMEGTMSAYEHSSSPVRHKAARRSRRMTVAGILRRAVQRWQRSRAVAALQQLDDRLLEDIGVTRNDIPRIVEGLFGDAAQESPAAVTLSVGPRVQEA
ncbi:DUF1127 domain-containing protein [Sinorhizobium meliloti]|uniref:DUF1127 domain-containing protein n=2 Tax=Rhizobium meliloti TaxID=382 RepID=UPI000FDCDB4B|nr:DUF1127 domain-containing protein [Sinorhizobium meliloti]MDW9979109.1 DUF1127 domain-containing protein [Sinorhizobium meliloti]MDX0295725.1 DUF1127 domain-containing protein [Sinorhizobium meliloti]RVI51771.1 DUF1127 domain-containing protein [Sinorhizobium meliloti]